jgi:hypothetical protein
MNRVTLWWKTQILKKVVFKDDGFTPYDCKGLQIVKGLPFEKGAEYKICDLYTTSHWDYLGRGRYSSPRCTTTDTKNPYWFYEWREKQKKIGPKIDEIFRLQKELDSYS